MKEIVEKDKRDFLDKYIDIFSVLFIPKDKWLAQREKEFLIEHVIANADNEDLLSRKFSKYLREEKMFKNRAVSIYRNKLKNKGWIIQTTDGVKLPSHLDYRSRSFPKTMSFKFKLSWKEFLEK